LRLMGRSALTFIGLSFLKGNLIINENEKRFLLESQLEEKIQFLITATQNCIDFNQQYNNPPTEKLFAHPAAHKGKVLWRSFYKQFPYLTHQYALETASWRARELLKENPLRFNNVTEISQIIDLILRESIRDTFSPHNCEENLEELSKKILACWLPHCQTVKPAITFFPVEADSKDDQVKEEIPVIVDNIEIVSPLRSKKEYNSYSSYNNCLEKIEINRGESEFLPEGSEQKNLITDYLIVHELTHSLDVWLNPHFLGGLVGKDRLGKLINLRWQALEKGWQEFFSQAFIDNSEERWFNQILRGELEIRPETIRKKLLWSVCAYFIKQPLANYHLPLTDIYIRSFSDLDDKTVLRAIENGEVTQLKKYLNFDPLATQALEIYPDFIECSLRKGGFLPPIMSFYGLKAVVEGKFKKDLNEPIINSCWKLAFNFFPEALAETIAFYYLLGTNNSLLPAKAKEFKEIMETWPEIKYFHAVKEALSATILASFTEVVSNKAISRAK